MNCHSIGTRMRCSRSPADPAGMAGNRRARRAGLPTAALTAAAGVVLVGCSDSNGGRNSTGGTAVACVESDHEYHQGHRQGPRRRPGRARPPGRREFQQGQGGPVWLAQYGKRGCRRRGWLTSSRPPATTRGRLPSESPSNRGRPPCDMSHGGLPLHAVTRRRMWTTAGDTARGKRIGQGHLLRRCAARGGWLSASATLLMFQWKRKAFWRLIE